MRKSVHTAEYAALRKRLVAVRETAGLSQRELARSLAVPHTWVAKVESGERRIDLIEFGWFCAACHVDPADIARTVLQMTGRETKPAKAEPQPRRPRTSRRKGGLK